MPVFISIEPTTSCNLRCPECPSGLREFSRPTGMLQMELFRNTILQLAPTLHTLTLYFQGEPYLNPQFTDMIAFASVNNIYTVTSTNAHYLTEVNAKKTVASGLDKLIISVDGITEETYRKYRVGGSFAKVVAGTKEILLQRQASKSRTPYIIWQFVVFSHNEHEISDLKKLGKELGVDEVKIKTAQIYSENNNGHLIPNTPELSRYIKNEKGDLKLKNKLLNQCWRMWQGCVVTWDGKVVPCCFDKDAKYQLGNVAEKSFSQIWYSDAYMMFRKSVLNSRSQIDICTNCTEGTQVFAEI